MYIYKDRTLDPEPFADSKLCLQKLFLLAWDASCTPNTGTLFTKHSTLHPAPSAPCTLHSAPCTLNPKPNPGFKAGTAAPILLVWDGTRKARAAKTSHGLLLKSNFGLRIVSFEAGSLVQINRPSTLLVFSSTNLAAKKSHGLFPLSHYRGISLIRNSPPPKTLQ